MKKIMVAAMALLLSLSFALDVDRIKKKEIAKKRVNDTAVTKDISTYSGNVGDTFDQGMNGYGWTLPSTRKMQTNMDPVTGSMVGAVYRRLDNDTGSGTVGGMVGEFGGDTFNGYAQAIYSVSPYQGGLDGNPGGRYPYANAFINGYFFGTFNDYDLTGATTSGYTEDSQPMFSVADATFGWDLSFWSTPTRVEATEGGATVPDAWTGNGDVVYDPATGYYYWTQTWGESLANLDDAILDVVVGRTLTPTDPTSWVWSDYNDLRFDGTDDVNGVTSIGDAYVHYCKDVEGNGTGYGILIANTNDVDDYMQNSAGEDVLQNGKISYMYTTNWGGDDTSGDWAPNWIGDADGKFFQIEGKDLLDWYDETIISRDSIGIDGEGNTIWDTTEVVTINDPSVQWAISGTATENNNIHVLFKVWPATIESPDSYYYVTDQGMRGGLYHVKGHISDTGVTWEKATQIAGFVDLDNYIFGEETSIEYKYYNSINMSIGYAGTVNDNEVIFASWLDKPESRAVASPFAELSGDSNFLDDIYFAASCDGGNYWERQDPIEYEFDDGTVWQQNLGTNISNTGSLHEDSFTLADRGSVDGDNFTIYGACQYYDPNTLTVPDNDDFACYAQYYKVWKISGSLDWVGIESEEVSLEKDFDLYQNYPNPFNPSTEIQFNLQNDADVKLAVFNTKGEMVANLKEGKMVKGIHKVNFDATSYNSGVYFYKLDVNGRSETRKMVLTK